MSFGSEVFFVQYAEAGIKNPRVSTREPPRLFVYIEQFLGKETRIWHFLWDPGAMFLGCLGPSEQKFLVTLIETAAKSGYTRFVEPCAGTFAMANLAVQNGFKPEQIETSDVNMMSTVLGYAITGQSLEPLEIHAQGFSDEELLDPATALYAQLYLRTSKNAGNDYFYQILTDLRLRREEHIESINRQIEVIKNLLGGMSYRPLDMWEHLKEVLDDPHALVIANPPTYFSGYEKFYDTQGKMTWKEPPYELFDPETRTPAVLRPLHGCEGIGYLLPGEESGRSGRIYDIRPLRYESRFECLHHYEPGGRGNRPCKR